MSALHCIMQTALSLVNTEQCMAVLYCYNMALLGLHASPSANGRSLVDGWCAQWPSYTIVSQNLPLFNFL